MAGKTVCFRRADWVVGWDADAGSHCYHQQTDVAFRDGVIVFAGPGRFEGHVDEEINASGLFLMPGLVDIHNHAATMPAYRGVREELGNPNFFFSGLYEGWGLFTPPASEHHHVTKLAHCELLLSGVTTYVDMSYPYPGWVDCVESSGIRASISPLFDCASIAAITPHQLEYRWTPDGGAASYARAMEVIAETEANACGRLSPMISPMSVDTCTPEMLRAAHKVAVEKNWPYHLHAAMSVMEFHEMTRRTGLTSIQWLDQLGVLNRNVIIGHGAIIDQHSWVHWHTREDLNILARSGVSISHCPVVLSRLGITLESFGQYRRAGINVGIGTDCDPHNMLEEIRAAAILSRVTDQHMFSATTADVFDAATVGGAKALLRDDIGRLTPGAKADIVVLDLENPIMQPLYDPLRSLIFSACDRAVKDVYVDGRKVVENGNVLTIDHKKQAEIVAEIQTRVVADMPNRDRYKRTALEVSPRTYPLRGVSA